MIMIRRMEGEDLSRFSPGQLVCHRRYGYRGVVVDSDASCKAPQEWYLANNTQPRRDQPWYHVLVHGTPTTTYAAHSSLQLDPVGGEIQHPLLAEFFEAYRDGRYVRNERPWVD